MTTMSVPQTARALEEYIRAAAETNLARMEKRSPATRPTELLELARLAEQGAGADVVEFADLVINDRLLTKHRAAAYALEKRSGIMSAMDEARAKIGNVHADAIIHYADAILHEQSRSGVRGTAAIPAVYLGTWKPDATYTRGNLATDKGCLWHCEADNTTDRPGSSAAWKLTHKSMEKR